MIIYRNPGADFFTLNCSAESTVAWMQEPWLLSLWSNLQTGWILPANLVRKHCPDTQPHPRETCLCLGRHEPDEDVLSCRVVATHSEEQPRSWKSWQCSLRGSATARIQIPSCNLLLLNMRMVYKHRVHVETKKYFPSAFSSLFRIILLRITTCHSSSVPHFLSP